MEVAGLRRHEWLTLSTLFSGWNGIPFAVQSYLLFLDFESSPLVPSAFKIQKANLYDQSAHISTVWFSCTTGFRVFFLTFLLMTDLCKKKKGIMEGCLVCEESEGERCCLCVWELKNPEMPEQQQQGIYSVNSYFMLLVFNGKTNKSTKIEILSFTF